MFNNIKEQLNQTPQEVKLYTGLTPMKVLAINPTEDKLREIIGEGATKFDTEYPLKEYDGVNTRPINLWVQDLREKAKPMLVSFNLSEQTVEFESGYYKIINDHNMSTISTFERIKENPKMSWYSQTGMRKEMRGETLLYTIIQRLIGFNTNGEKNFMEALAEEKLDFATVYGGNFSGLRNLVEFAKANKFALILPLVVREHEGNYYQNVLLNQDLIFRGTEVTASTVRRFKSLYENSVARGYPLTQHFFTYEFQEFKEEECVNSAPQNDSSDDEIIGW
jgi:hypothetical protein